MCLSYCIALVCICHCIFMHRDTTSCALTCSLAGRTIFSSIPTSAWRTSSPNIGCLWTGLVGQPGTVFRSTVDASFLPTTTTTTNLPGSVRQFHTEHGGTIVVISPIWMDSGEKWCGALWITQHHWILRRWRFDSNSHTLYYRGKLMSNTHTQTLTLTHTHTRSHIHKQRHMYLVIYTYECLCVRDIYVCVYIYISHIQTHTHVCKYVCMYGSIC